MGLYLKYSRKKGKKKIGGDGKGNKNERIIATEAGYTWVLGDSLNYSLQSVFPINKI